MRVFTALLLLVVLSPAAGGYAPDQPLPLECERLRALERQYRGVSLNAAQQHIKNQLKAWYSANCRGRRAAG